MTIMNSDFSTKVFSVIFLLVGAANATFWNSHTGCNDDDGVSVNNPPLNGGKTICPVDNPSYLSTGVVGCVVDNNDGWYKAGRRYNLYHYFSDWPYYAGVTSASQCRDLCNSWPMSPTGKALTPTNGQSGRCAHWSFNGNSDCYLFGCGVCNSAKSFDPEAKFNSKYYISGAGPGIKDCTSGVKGDPHFSGADNSHFDFTGVPDKNYCLISDSHIHVNGYYDGRYGQWGNQTHKPLTWIRKVGILWGHHTLKLEARKGAEWRYGSGYMANMEIDGETITLAQQGDSVSYSGDKIRIKYVAAKKRDGDDEVDVYEVNVGDVLSMRLTLRPEVENLRTATDGVVHFNLEFLSADLSNNAHGVLGQTYRMDHSDRLSKQELVYDRVLGMHVVKGSNAEGFIDGSAKDYASSDLMKADCKFGRFARAMIREDETARAIERSSSAAVSSFAPRKILNKQIDLGL